MPPGLAIREHPSNHPSWDGSWRHDLSIEGFVLESWSQGFMVGALVIMAGLTVANMRPDLLLHKLILIELILAAFHGTFCFMDFEGYGWYVSSTAVLLYSSWYLHNIIAWMKTKPFLRPLYSKIYIMTFLLTTPYWILETYGNFTFNNNIGREFLRTRPFEALCRDPWWIFTAVNLLYNIKQKYNFGYIGLIQTSPRFGIMLVSMLFSIVFLIVDVLSATVKFGAVVGINPYWKLSLVFKCFCDTIILDDFRSALEKIRTVYFNHLDPYVGQFDHKDWRNSTDGKNKSRQNPIQPLPEGFVLKTDIRETRSITKPATMLGGIFNDQRHSDLEESKNIYISTDITMDRESVAGSDTASQISTKKDRLW